MKILTSRAAALVAAMLGLTLISSTGARAQLFSTNDGFTQDGKYQLQTELTPYLWLPAVSGTLHSASPRIGDVDFNTGFPTPADLAHSLHAAFMGTGLVRYGPWTAEIDIQYLDASQSTTVFTGRFGRVYRVNTSLSFVRVAPGFGYKVYTGQVFGLPVMVDARAGFAYTATDEKFVGEGPLGVGTSNNGSFVQPWLGGRITVVPSPRWRVELGSLVQGLGVDDGSWGWGGSLVGSYALTNWANFSFGFRALETQRVSGSGDGARAQERSFSALTYGPVIGVGFRF